MAFDSKLQRQVMGRFATGVTLVTTRYGEQIWGMTANAVMSLSLDPPRILISIDRQNRMHKHLSKSKCFAVNMLTKEQEAISRRFASSGPKDLSDLALSVAETGAPILDDALAFIDCRLVQVVPGGDHDMFIGEPIAGNVGNGQPLIFYGGNYT